MSEKPSRIDELIEEINFYISEVRPSFAAAALRVRRKVQPDEFFHPVSLVVENRDTKESMTILLNEVTDTMEVFVGSDYEEILDGNDFWRNFYILNRNTNLKGEKDD